LDQKYFEKQKSKFTSLGRKATQITGEEN
jgi:hypothetical protein